MPDDLTSTRHPPGYDVLGCQGHLDARRLPRIAVGYRAQIISTEQSRGAGPAFTDTMGVMFHGEARRRRGQLVLGFAANLRL